MCVIGSRTSLRRQIQNHNPQIAENVGGGLDVGERRRGSFQSNKLDAAGRYNRPRKLGGGGGGGGGGGNRRSCSTAGSPHWFDAATGVKHMFAHLFIQIGDVRFADLGVG